MVEAVNDCTLENFGINGHDDPYFFLPETNKYGYKNPKITSTSIYDEDAYAILFFFMRKGQVMPLHDHPEMSVFTRVLTGRLRVRALDKINKDWHSHKNEMSDYVYFQNSHQLNFEAIVKTDEILEENDTKLTLPYENNIHSFEAVED